MDVEKVSVGGNHYTAIPVETQLNVHIRIFKGDHCCVQIEF